MLLSVLPTRSAHSARPPSRRHGPAGRRYGALAAAAGGLLLAGCGAEQAGGAQTSEQDVSLEHVHGIGVDPADGALYAGTHHGLVHVSPDGELTRVADRVQDYMGFTVVGPEHYLASGHPGDGQPGPGDLGLIETTDGGQTWTTLSLAAEADFHALDAADGMIYGYSGGQLLVSEDGVDWTDRGSMRIADLAVDPNDPRRVLATTEQGLVLSEDAGENFTGVPGSPVLVVVDIALDGGSAAGVAPDGTVHVSTDGGLTWERRGDVGGPPEALTVDGQGVYVAVEGAILASTDGGANFVDLYREQ
ncbi:BNR/Asp-box repeat-containing protein [Modestobacter sp. DSM 44400]|uniref:F510_1955 family glycosylhydrolase n=1 Tax=Modestobacter sp. DSM 44400 TaxID=1550230 RepID=UPI00089CB36E|nr:exo-alpha-sialidase [Modestobacter sp. DSM 44400]SDY80765.1 BNR/Asp-box repeat-containing protein [Modestobacter sp. DSM 44400]